MGNNDDVGQFDETKTNFILEDLQKILINIQLSTMGTESEDDFDNLFEDMDLNSTKLGKTPDARNIIIAKVLSHLDKIDFGLEDTESDVLGDSYEYLISQFASGAISNENVIMDLVSGTGIGAGKLDISDLQAQEFIYPSLSEQKKIASFLTAVDDKLQDLKKKRFLLEQYKKGVMQKIFSQELRFN